MKGADNFSSSEGPPIRLLRHLAKNRERLQKKHKIYTLVIWVGGDKKAAARLVKEHGLEDLAFAVVSASDREYLAWKIHEKATNTLVLIHRGKTLETLANVKPEDIPGLEARLVKRLTAK